MSLSPLSPSPSHKTFEVLVIGATGNVGREVLSILRRQRDEWMRMSLDVSIVCTANTKEMVFPQSSVTLRIPLGAGVEFLCREIEKKEYRHLYIFDCTASDDVTNAYPRLLELGVLITCNKRGSSGPLHLWQDIARHIAGGRYRYESTVMAGLPVMSSLRSLTLAGDRIVSVSGVFSGTMSFVFNGVTGGLMLSDCVKEAKRRGYTEPDPRDDLRGTDFARKLVVLGRELGLRCTVEDIRWTSDPIVPKEMEDISLDQFLEALPSLDQPMLDRVKAAESRGNRLVFMGSVNVNAVTNALSCGVTEVSQSGPFGGVTGTNNIISITSNYYDEASPMVICGPGAGAIVTASGMIADLLR
jgi:aspartokinase/homoserine dehydrogenase 1